MKRAFVWLVVGVGLGVVLSGWLRRQIDIDRCLDAGGRWAPESGHCQFE